MPKGKIGKLSKAEEKRRRDAYKAHGSDGEAAESLGMKVGTFYQWRESRKFKRKSEIKTSRSRKVNRAQRKKTKIQSNNVTKTTRVTSDLQSFVEMLIPIAESSLSLVNDKPTRKMYELVINQAKKSVK